jgi:hypothetical protein
MQCILSVTGEQINDCQGPEFLKKELVKAKRFNP